MNKKQFERFISKYNLGGACESVTYTISNNTMSTRAMSDDKNVLCEVNIKNVDFPDGEYSIYDTGKLKSLLGVLGDELEVKTSNGNAGRVLALRLRDDRSTVSYAVANPSIIPAVPTLTSNPEFNTWMTLDEKFTTAFIRARLALSDIETFHVVSDGSSTTAHVILGISTQNTSRVTIDVEMDSPTKIDEMSFSSKYLREILSANKDATHGKMSINSLGLAKLIFSTDDITSVYYLVKTTSN